MFWVGVGKKRLCVQTPRLWLLVFFADLIVQRTNLDTGERRTGTLHDNWHLNLPYDRVSDDRIPPTEERSEPQSQLGESSASTFKS